MRSKQEDTPPPSPGVGEDDELYEDEIAEEIDVIEGEAEVGTVFHTNYTCFGYVTLVENPSAPPQGSAVRDPASKVTSLQSPGLGVHEDQFKF